MLEVFDLCKVLWLQSNKGLRNPDFPSQEIEFLHNVKTLRRFLTGKILFKCREVTRFQKLAANILSGRFLH